MISTIKVAATVIEQLNQQESSETKRKTRNVTIKSRRVRDNKNGKAK
jgi:hypothetical protein